MFAFRRPAFCIAFLLLALTGCARSGADDQAQKAFPFVRLSPSAPPVAPYEMQPHAADPINEVWRAGYWDYDGSSFTWVSGKFIYRPDPTAAWTPDRWEQRAFGWAFIPGYWQ